MKYYNSLSKIQPTVYTVEEILNTNQRTTIDELKESAIRLANSKKKCLFHKSASEIEALWRENRIKIEEAKQNTQETPA